MESILESNESILVEEKKIVKPKNEIFYEIYGTLENTQMNDYFHPIKKSSPKILNYKDKSTTEIILSCDIIIFDISNEIQELTQAILILTKLEENFKKIESTKKPNKKYFILISTLMTWAETM